MLSINSISASKNVGELAAYYEGYYTGGENPRGRTSDEPPGVWRGGLAKELGMEGLNVETGDLLKAFKGMHPKTGEAIVKNAGDGHKPGHDLCFSAPKSVSVIWAASDDATREKLGRLHAEAVAAAMDESAKCGAFVSRYGKAGKTEVPVQNLAYATFEHSSSRSGDPQLHTHCIVVNADQNGRSITFNSSYTHYLGALYRANLAKALEKEGYAVQADKRSFAVTGVPQTLQSNLSKRAAQIKSKMDEKGFESYRAERVAGLETRSKKTELPRAIAIETARTACEAHGFDPAAIKSGEPQKGKAWDDEEVMKEFLSDQSYYTKTQIRTRLIQAAQTRDISIKDAVAKIDGLMSKGEVIPMTNPYDRQVNADGKEKPAAQWYALASTVKMERELATWAEQIKTKKTDQSVTEDHKRVATEYLAQKGIKLSDDQENAFNHITGSERFAMVQGRAGAGKSTMLDAAREAWQQSGQEVIGGALSGKAAEGLEESSGIKSQTLHSLLSELDSGAKELSSKSVVVIDEAATVGSRQMSDLLRHVESAHAKLVLVGDAAQHQAAEYGGPFLAMQRRAGAAMMTEIRRQKDEGDRATVRALSDKKIPEALERMQNKGQIQIVNREESRIEKAASQSIEALSGGKSSVILADTNKSAAEINERARELAIQKGLVDTSQGITYIHNDGSSIAIAKGDRVMADRNSRAQGLKNGHTGTVESVSGNTISIRLDNGKVRDINLEEYRHIKHAYCLTGAKAQGVTVQNCIYVPSQSNMQALYVAASRHKEDFKVLVTKDMQEHEGGLKSFFDSDATKYSTTDLDLARDKTGEKLAKVLSAGSSPSDEHRPDKAVKRMADKAIADAKQRERSERSERVKASKSSPSPATQERDRDLKLLKDVEKNPGLEAEIREKARELARERPDEFEVENQRIKEHGR